jgi:DNA polymerase III gamma/tau subunit
MEGVSMLDDYKDKQSVAYNIMMNEINNDHISHAYLIDENNNNDSFNIVMAFIKEILCSKLDVNDRQVLCKRIDDDNYPEIKIIEPDGMLIKKKQILDLQQEFSRSAFEGSKRIYIIRDADKMRSETANSMLKFLEEPDNDIIAILMTNNFNNLLSTIISRCQVIRLNNDNVDVNDSELDLLVINFIKSVENNGVRTIMKEQELLFNTVPMKDRDKLLNVFDKMIDMYYDIMKINTENKFIKFNNYLDILTNIASKNTNNEILNKINFLVDAKETVKNNVNVNLLVDSVIINIGG